MNMFAKLCQWFHCRGLLLPSSSVLKVLVKRGLVDVDVGVVVVDDVPRRRSAPLLTRRCDPYLVAARSSTSGISLCSSSFHPAIIIIHRSSWHRNS